MFEINNTNFGLILKSDADKLKIPIISIYLKRLRFEEHAESSLINKEKNVEEILKKIIPYLKNYDDIQLDDYCQNVILDVKNEEEKFLKLIEQAAKIKNQDHEYWKNFKIDIPEMSDKVELKWYQKMPVMHAITIGNSANFSVPGSGKTWMAYATFFKLKQEKKVNKLLIVAPLAAFKPWEIEYEVMTGKPHEIQRIVGLHHERRSKFNSHDNEIFLISYTVASIDIELLKKLLKSSNFMMIIDESHHIKNPDANRTIAIHELAPLAKNRMILSGTMMPKSLVDLWSQFTFLYPDKKLLSTYEQYKYQCEKIDSSNTISNQVNPYFTRISKNLLNLPEPIFNSTTDNGEPIIVSMSPIQRRIYDNIANNLRNNFNEFRGDVLALIRFRKKAIIYLIEAATDPSLLTKDNTYQSDEIDPTGLDMFELLEKYPRLKEEPLKKLDRAIELAKKTLNKNEKVIIWCSFIETIKKLSKYFENEGYNSVQIYGAIPRDNEVNEEFNREKEIEKFKTNSKYNVLIANPASLAESVSLHKNCHHAIYVDRTFNGGHYMQSLERIHRVGLDPSVNTRYDIIQSERSVDQTIHASLGIKKENMENFFNYAELSITPTDYDSENSIDGDRELTDDFKAVLDDVNKNVKSS